MYTRSHAHTSAQHRHIYKYYIWTNTYSVKIHPNQFYICQLIHLPLAHSLWFHLPPPTSTENGPNQTKEWKWCFFLFAALSLFLHFVRLVALHCIHNFRNVSISRWPKFGTEQMAFTNGTVIFLNGFRLLRIIICEKYLKQFEAGARLGLARLGSIWFGLAGRSCSFCPFVSLALWLSVLAFVRFIYVKHVYYRLHIVCILYGKARQGTARKTRAYVCVCHYNIDTEFARVRPSI